MLADLVPVILETRIERRRPLTATERHMRWVAKNRAAWNAYRRDWYRKKQIAKESACSSSN